MRYLSKKEVAQRLDLSTRTVDRYVQQGMLRPKRLPNGRPRFPETQVARLLESAPALLTPGIKEGSDAI